MDADGHSIDCRKQNGGLLFQDEIFWGKYHCHYFTLPGFFLIKSAQFLYSFDVCGLLI